ncbi:MAG: hypothetical protein C5B49_06525 [Bdellovibrio sp.]|nr:MAG: hypothetical protein C5B49_06525 [Bdellovibrio sp.]
MIDDRPDADELGALEMSNISDELKENPYFLSLNEASDQDNDLNFSMIRTALTIALVHRGDGQFLLTKYNSLISRRFREIGLKPSKLLSEAGFLSDGGAFVFLGADFDFTQSNNHVTAEIEREFIKPTREVEKTDF